MQKILWFWISRDITKNCCFFISFKNSTLFFLKKATILYVNSSKTIVSWYYGFLIQTRLNAHARWLDRIRLSRPVLRYTRSVLPGRRSSNKLKGRRAGLCGLQSTYTVRPGNNIVGDVNVCFISRGTVGIYIARMATLY